ncbi:hypothetical protein DFQ28_004119, partial [Apophysomyces sp. BC1034]
MSIPTVILCVKCNIVFTGDNKYKRHLTKCFAMFEKQAISLTALEEELSEPAEPAFDDTEMEEVLDENEQESFAHHFDPMDTPTDEANHDPQVFEYTSSTSWSHVEYVSIKLFKTA